MNKFCIVPYLPVDGILPFRDSFVIDFWNRMVADGTAKNVFFDASVVSGLQFLAKAKQRDGTFFFCMDDQTPAAVCWLDGFCQRRANIHFCVLRPYWGAPAKALGALALRTIGGMRNANGDRLFHMLAGTLEASNTLAIRFAQSLGLTRCGIVPHYLYNAWAGSNVDAVMMAYQFEEA